MCREIINTFYFPFCNRKHRMSWFFIVVSLRRTAYRYSNQFCGKQNFLTLINLEFFLLASSVSFCVHYKSYLNMKHILKCYTYKFKILLQFCTILVLLVLFLQKAKNVRKILGKYFKRYTYILTN